MAAARGNFPFRALPARLALAIGLVVGVAGSAIAQPAPTPTPTPTPMPTPPPAAAQTDCTYQGEDYLVTVINPPPADRQLIMDLIHRYNWALDEGTQVGLNDILMDNVTYELCTAAHQQLLMLTNRVQLKQHLDAVTAELTRSLSTTRHIESNTLLNAVSPDTVQGKTTLLVTIQFTGIEMPVLDYTATLHTVFIRDGTRWKFSSIRLITDGPKVKLRAR
jgi:SnoaL-like domain